MLPLPVDKLPRFTVTKSQFLVLILVVITSIVLWFAHRSYVSGEARPAPAAEARLLSLQGVLFLIPDREALVLPSNYVSGEERDKSAPRVTNFTLCSKLPDLQFYGDVESRKKCLAIGYEPAGDWIVIDVSGREVSKPPEGLLHSAMGRYLKNKIGHPDSQVVRSKRAVWYVAGEDKFGLRTFYPTGPNLRRSSETLFWRGGNLDEERTKIDTLIECNGYLPEQSSPLKKCTHRYYLSAELFDGREVQVTLYYDEQWLPEWESIEKDTRESILRLRAP